MPFLSPLADTISDFRSALLAVCLLTIDTSVATRTAAHVLLPSWKAGFKLTCYSTAQMSMTVDLYSSRWSALSRNERYRTRCGPEGTAELDAANPLPERVDPITLEPVVSPAISPYGHVMGAATWKVRF